MTASAYDFTTASCGCCCSSSFPFRPFHEVPTDLNCDGFHDQPCRTFSRLDPPSLLYAPSIPSSSPHHNHTPTRQPLCNLFSNHLLSRSRGKVVCQLSVPLCDLLDQVLRDHHQRQTERNQQLLAQELREQQQLMQYKEIHEHQQQEYQQQQQRCHRRSWWSAVPSGAHAVKSAFNAFIAVPAAGDGLPPYHPDTWPRGRVALTARIGGPGGASAVTHGPSMGPDGAARECRFLFEVEVVDADPRAVANGTQLLPGAQPLPLHNSLPIPLHQQKQPHQLHSLQDGAPGLGVCQEGTLNSGPVVRQGYRLSRAGEGPPEGLLSPPWSPTAVSKSRMGGDVSMLSPAGVGIGEVLR